RWLVRACRPRGGGHPGGRGDPHHDRVAGRADRQAGEDRRGGRRRPARPDRRTRRHLPDQRLRRAGPARRAGAQEGGGREVSGNDYWTLALVIGLVAALVVVVLLVLLLQSIGRTCRSVSVLLEVAGQVGANTASIPQLEATAPVLAKIVDEAVVQDGYMNALTDGYGTPA